MVDYLIVGAGLTGAVCARELADAGKRVLVLEKQSHPGGNCHTTRRDGILCVEHGGHIFHTNDKRLWDYVRRWASFRQYTHHVKAHYRGTFYSFPPNLMTAQQLGVTMGTPEGDSAIRRTFFDGYTAKQWGRPIEQVPASVVKRIPWRCNWDDRYFTDTYQGLPEDGYTDMISNMLHGLPVEYGTDYLARAHYWDSKARRVIFTGPIDALMGHQLGRLEYRSLRFEWERHEVPDYQGAPTINYTDAAVPYTRVLEHKHWWPAAVPYTWITREYPAAEGPEYYPVADSANRALYRDYRALAAGYKSHVRLGGRLGSYKYMDMAPAIAAALHLVRQELN